MEENKNILESIYKDANMAVYTLNTLLKNLENKDNKIKSDIEKIFEEYKKYESEAKDLLIKNDLEVKEINMLSKLSSDIGVKKEVIDDNSDASIADMLIKGVSMGSIDIDKCISVNKKADKKILEFAKDFHKFQEKTIEKLKKHL